GLAGAVLAHKRMNFAGIDIQVHAAQGGDGAKFLGYAPHLQEGWRSRLRHCVRHHMHRGYTQVFTATRGATSPDSCCDRNMRFQVGLTTISLRQTRSGNSQTTRIKSARSSGCSMRSRSACGTGTGRLSRTGVATWPGHRAQERMLLANSSILIAWLMATTACLAALYPAPASLWLCRPSQEAVWIINPP